MSEDELATLAAIRERLRHIELSLDRHAHESAERSEKLESDLRELTRTVVRLSEAVTTITVRLNVAGAGAGAASSGSASSSAAPMTPAIAAGSAGGGLAIAAYYALKALGL